MTKQSPSTANEFCQVRQSVLVLAIICLLLAISACSAEKDATEAKPYPPPNPLFYELANADGEVEGWLLGTIHALPSGVLWRTPAIDEVVSEADLLLVEVAELGASAEVARVFAEISRTPGLPPVAQRISPALHSDLELMLAGPEVSQSNLRDAEDWAAAIMLAQVDAPGEPRYGVDRALIGDFEGRDIKGFETARRQLGIFDSLAAEDQRALLEGTIEEWAQSKDRPGSLLRAWIAGDAELLEKATVEGIMADPELRDALLVNRNKDWIEQLIPVLGSGQKPLIAVGAAHLVGPDGLPEMLKQRGITARRVATR